ncbi:MAG TPA: Na+/H+ antiporter NhaA [Rhizomicrobium sp.]|jgi:NhaA family Na+:H+ antiporter|nr:Na+/H+ antiporter NhaA [Rhizomicrobium sp.]
MPDETPSDRLWLRHPIDPGRDHIRGNLAAADAVTVVLYGDYLCPYCRRLRPVMLQLRDTLGDRFVYVYRHFPNEKAHPGATFMARATEAAARQGRFFEMHDWLFDNPAPNKQQVLEHIRTLGLDMARFEHDLESDDVRRHVETDHRWARQNGVTGTPTIFIDGLRYDGAWDYYSMLEAFEQPVATRIARSARAFASLPASGGIALLLAAAAALLLANSALAPLYGFIHSPVGIGPPGAMLSMPVADWCSEGLLAVFFLLVGLEIRRELTAGSLTDVRAAILPAVAAAAGTVTPAAIYLLFNRGPTAPGWAVPTATGIAFTLGILALFGQRIPQSLRVFIAAYAVIDDVCSVLTLAIFYPHGFHPVWLGASAATVAILYAFNRSRVYAAWPYVVATAALWIFLHLSGVHAALAGIALAFLLPTRPAPAAGPLLAQAATALATLEHAQTELQKAGVKKATLESDAVWEWAGSNLSAVSDRLLSPADRIERAVSPWTAYLALPLFAFSTSGVALSLNMAAPDTLRILAGVILGLLVGKPAGVFVSSILAVKLRIAVLPKEIGLRDLFGAACLCGVGDTLSFLMADQAFRHGPDAAAAKIGVLIGSALAAILGVAILALKNPSAVAQEMTPVQV